MQGTQFLHMLYISGYMQGEMLYTQSTLLVCNRCPPAAFHTHLHKHLHFLFQSCSVSFCVYRGLNVWKACWVKPSLVQQTGHTQEIMAVNRLDPQTHSNTFRFPPPHSWLWSETVLGYNVINSHCSSSTLH